MKKKFALGLLTVLTLLSVPALAAAPVVSDDLAVDEFIFASDVSTELVTAVRCPVQTLGCGSAWQDCGVEWGICHCKPGGGTLTCVKIP